MKVITCLVFVVAIAYCCINKSNTAENATYVGTEKCQTCHKQEYDLYKTSDHFHAMDTVSSNSVKGNFNNSQFIYNNDTAYFYQHDGKYFVRTTDTTGKKKEFTVSYTFGYKPLQQYLVKFDDGRIQTLPFCWDTRDVKDGGQKWFHLYNKEKIPHTDELFWMNINQNWNYMCADCHTTNYAKNFDLQTNSFHSKWNESKVSCESCHGPASEHIKWTENKNSTSAYKGFAISLAMKSMNWKMDAAKQTLIPDAVVKHDTLIETCARCHARASRFTDEYKHGKSFLQSHIPSTIDAVNYYSDGQIKEEDYEYGSFLQSKMYAAGVTCSNCHNPHSGKIKITGNDLCGSCHSAQKYDGPQHSFHQINSTGNKCVNCHMPTTNYMVIDARLDHSIRIPRPDLSVSTGNPNACNKCHTDKTVQWASENFLKRHGAKLPKEKTYGELMHLIARYQQNAEASLYQLLQTPSYPDIIKATAMEQYGFYNTSRISNLIVEQLKSTNPNLRLNAIKAVSNYAPESIVANVAPLLQDPVLAVKFEAINSLSAHFEKLEEKDQKIFTKVKDEYFKVQEQMSHRPEGFFNRAIVLSNLGKSAEAEKLYIDCISRFPTFIPAFANLIDFCRLQERHDDAKLIIDKGLIVQPKNGFLHYSLGLWLIRKQEKNKALEELKTAANLSPENAQFVYGYAIGLFSMGNASQALQLLELYINKYGNNATILDGLISINHDLNNKPKEEKYTNLRKSVFGN